MITRALFALPALVSALALFTLMVMTFADVMLRSMFNAPIEVAADMTRVLMAVTVFAVMPVLSWRGGQISVDLLDGYVDRWAMTRWRNAAVDLLCGAVLIWPAQRVWVLAERSRSYGDVMEYLGMPLFYVGWFICASIWITALVLIVRGLLALFAPRLLDETHD